jgi:hypothetical protein
MPRYHFNIHDGADFPDEEGSELIDLAAARATAVRLAADLLKEGAAHFWNGEGWRVDVTDDQGLLLFTLMFSGYDAPSVR